MRRYKLTLTWKDIARRLTTYSYSPRLLRELTLVSNKFDIEHGIQYRYEQISQERDAVH